MFTYSLSGLEIKAAAETLQEVEENETTARSAVYQVLGTWFRPPDADHFSKSGDGRWAKELTTAAELLPFAFSVEEPADSDQITEAQYMAEWSRLFGEATADGSALRSGSYDPDSSTTIPDVQREYEYFGLAAGSAEALPADHLSTELEFMGFVCFKEAAVSSDRLRASYRRAQSDFLSRFLSGWTPTLVSSSIAKNPLAPFAWTLGRLEEFLAQDRVYLGTLLGT